MEENQEDDDFLDEEIDQPRPPSRRNKPPGTKIVNFWLEFSEAECLNRWRHQRMIENRADALRVCIEWTINQPGARPRLEAAKEAPEPEVSAAKPDRSAERTEAVVYEPPVIGPDGIEVQPKEWWLLPALKPIPPEEWERLSRETRRVSINFRMTDEIFARFNEWRHARMIPSRTKAAKICLEWASRQTLRRNFGFIMSQEEADQDPILSKYPLVHYEMEEDDESPSS